MLYNYEASNKDGVISKGKLDAKNQAEAISYLERKGLIPILIEKEGEIRSAKKTLSISLFETVKPIDRIILSRNLSVAIKAGLNMMEALDILITDANKSIMKKILGDAKFNLQKGQPLSATFGYYKKYFPPVFVGLVKAGEASGKLEKTLDELSQQLTKEYNLIKKVKSALAYPILLLAGSIGVVIMLLVFVMPRLAKSFQMTKVELPIMTKILINLSNFLTQNIILDLLIIAGLVWFFIFYRSTPSGKRFFTKLSLRIPIMKDLVKKVAITRFTRTLGSLLSSGLNVIEALGLSAEAVSNEAYQKVVLDSVSQVKSGLSLSKIFEKRADLFPSLLINMMTVGEKTGTLEQILKTFSDFYDEEIDNTLKDLTTFLEPLLLLVMGLIIAFIAFAILMPIYQLVGKFT